MDHNSAICHVIQQLNERFDMDGQWTGEINGTNNGQVILDLESTPNGISGFGLFLENDNQLPSTAFHFENITLEESMAFNAPIEPFVPGRYQPLEREELIKQGIMFGKNADILIRQPSTTYSEMILTWKTDTGTNGSGILTKSRADLQSEVLPISEVDTWDKFVRFVQSHPNDRYVYRGQSAPWRLRTSFHRTKRKILPTYLLELVPKVDSALTSTIGARFHHDDPIERGAFFHLLQHHGFPTPLLDWSYSPFVAAYFAFHETRRASESETVRIYFLDAKKWRQDCPQFDGFTLCHPHFSFHDLVPLHNPRAIPQQSATTLTTVDDIEGYIKKMEILMDTGYLSAIDLPITERTVAMNSLLKMGVTPGSLFGNIDGICQEYRLRYFDLMS